jgi:hypothetical protein
MSTRIACQKCGASILPATAERTGGLCMPCTQPRRRDLGKLLAQPSTVLSLQEYLALMRDLPLPTSEQRRNFVEYVSSAHSWYKHLPRFLPGAPFYFYMDKFAGCECVSLEDGSFAIAERETQGFHYSDLPTDEYLRRFGFLSYSCAEGTAVFSLTRGPMAVPRDSVLAIPGEDGNLCCLPPPILEAGRVDLTTIIHPASVSCHFGAHSSTERQRKIHWPSESGGEPTLKKIVERCAEMEKPAYAQEEEQRWADSIRLMKTCRTPQERSDLIERAQRDPILLQLMAPERLRQKAEMLKAIDRVCMLVQEAGSSAPDSRR